MALKKKIELDNGVIVNYHRIVAINKITNIQNIIEVASYTNELKREEEKEAIKNAEEMNIFIYTDYIITDYNEEMTIDKAYKYLKTLDKYKKAENC